MRVLICAATEFELRAVRKALDLYQSSTKYHWEFLLTGVGQEQVAKTINNIGPHFLGAFDLIVSTGFAGVNSSKIKLGTWVRSPSGTEKIKKLLPHSRIQVLHLLPAQELIVYQNDEQEASMIDMESETLSQFAERSKLEFLILRVISDNPLYPFPTFVSDFTRGFSDKNPLLWVKALAAMMCRPKDSVLFLKQCRNNFESLHAMWVSVGKESTK